MIKNLDLDSQFKGVLNKLETSENHIFLTGNAGTGKSTLLEYWRDHTKQNIAVLAPTGVAALNIKGQTIHSFFGFRPDITVQKIQRFYRNRGKKGLFKKLDTIVIDEISMVRADLLDCIDAFLRIHGKNHNLPFGGVKMIFIGDLHQLPPVVMNSEKEIFSNFYKTPYFFSSQVFDGLDFEFIELKKIYRQTDKEFIEILDSIRNNNISGEQLMLLNSRVDEQFETPANKFFITLTTTNKKTQIINDHHLGKIFNKRFIYEGQGTGKFDVKALPTSGKLEIKPDAQIMMVANDREGRWVNGSLGKISQIETDKKGGADIIIVELENGQEVAVTPHTWEMFRVEYNPATNKLNTESIGSYKQYPLTLAWAITIHKSQGKTFDNVIIDFGWGTFAHGQAYVALSRCTNLNGIVLSKPFEKSYIITDEQVKKFLSTFKYLADSGSNSNIDLETKNEALIEIINKAIDSESLLKFVDGKNTQRTVSPEIILFDDANNKQLKAHCFTTNKI
ncbi:AAA family ATPase, partial [Patescibacteria group bacterium]|nr:AAA family ATPase [Patescibacteria group bacterium]